MGIFVHTVPKQFVDVQGGIMQQTVAGHAMDLLANEIRTSLPPITLRVTNVIGYIILIAVNIAASTGLLGPTNAEVSARHPTPLTPAGWGTALHHDLRFPFRQQEVLYKTKPSSHAHVPMHLASIQLASHA